MRRGWMLGGVLAVVVAVAVTLVVVTPSERVAGEPVAADPAGAASAALDQLAGMANVQLSGWVSTETAQRLRVDIVATDNGVQAVVEDEAGGAAEIVAGSGKNRDQAAIKANSAWWLNTVPAYQQDYTDRWVKADDTMGFPVSALGGLSGTEIRGLVTARSADWTATPVVFHDGRPAMELTRGDTGWRVFVTPTEPPRLLGIGGPLLAKADRLVRQGDARVFPDAEFGTSEPGTDCRDQTDRTVDQTTPTIAGLPAPRVSDPDDRPELQGQVSAPPGVCMTPVCPFTVLVMNIGRQAGVGTVMITSSSGPPMTAPLDLPPGGQFTTVYEAPNPAPPSEGGRVTVTISVQAFAQVTSLAGPDVDAGKRLHDRGVDPDDPVPAKPSATGPGITGIMDGLTSGAPVVGLRRQEGVIAEARLLLGDALDAGLTALLDQLVHAPALRDGADPAHTPLIDLFKAAAKGRPAEQELALRTLKVLVSLTQGNPAPGSVYVQDNGVIVDDATKHAYVIGQLKGGLDAQQSVDGLYDEIQRARGLLDAKDVVPDGYAKVVEVDVRGTQAGSLGVRTRAGIRDVLRDGRPKGRSFRDVLLDDGEPAVDTLRIVSPTSGLPNRGARDGALVFDQSDLVALGQKKDTGLPATPPATLQPRFTPYTSQHTWEGDSPDEHDETGGGHGYGVGAPEKTEYPQTWTQPVAEQRAIEVVQRAIANKRQGSSNDGDGTSANGTTIGPPIDNKNQMDVEVGSWVVHGTSNGVELEITVLQDGTIASAYPTGRVVDGNGVLQPYESIKNPADPNLPFENPKLPPGAPRAELENPNTGKTKGYSISQTQRSQYRRVGADGEPEWVYRGTAQPGGGTNPKVDVEVTRTQDGKHKKTTRSTPPKQTDPPPAVCGGA
ncbi:EndoU domain-containing protein [Actinophytocola sp.]|uniref:EndoU domain-containing protein n=1 Tax=Actinophytocola sp. TaxID=1872138 RepID=UPI00389A0149